MKVSDLKEGERAYFMVDLEGQRTWEECRVLAVSTYGFALEHKMNGQTVQKWYDVIGAGAALRFRRLIEYWHRWTNKKHGGLYELVMFANQKATMEGFVPTVVFKSTSTGDIYSLPIEQFHADFTQHEPVQGVPF